MGYNSSVLLALVLVSCILAGSRPAVAHSGHTPSCNPVWQPPKFNGTPETDAAAAAMLSTAQPFPPAVPVAKEAMADAAPIARRTCGTPTGTNGQRASTERRFQQTLQQLQARGEDVSVATARPPVITVYFHVILLSQGNEVQGMVTQAQVNNQIARLNAAYAGIFIFTLARATWYTTNSTALFNAKIFSPGEASIKQLLHKGSASTLNIYTWGVGDSILGWATFPWWYCNSPRIDGVVLLYGTIIGGSAAKFNMGTTAVHEIGHWAGLYHTFQNGCGTVDVFKTGDYVADTPAAKEANYGCLVYGSVDSCIDKQGPDLVQNFMDYGDDACLNSFTSGQRFRVKDAWAAWRSGR